MKRAVVIACFLVGAAVAVAVSEEARVLAFGWLTFVGRNLSHATVDPRAIAAGVVATALSVLAIDLFARWCCTTASRGPGAVAHRWRFRWTLSIIIVVGLLFASGISVMGIARQVGWLLSSQ